MCSTLLNRARISLMGLALFMTASSLLFAQPARGLARGKAEPPVRRLRYTWWSDPATSAAIGWEQGVLDAELYYDEREQWSETGELKQRAEVSVARRVSDTRWVHLTQLKPDTAYQFQIKTSAGDSEAFWLKTAPNEPKEMSFIIGGDSRNHRKTRRLANQVVAQLTPTAVLFGGDFTAQDTKRQWRKWLDDWQLSISEDRRLTPLVPTRGNHDSERSLKRAWGEAYPQFYYALSFGGELVRVYTLNSERPAGGEQRAWLEADLTTHASSTLKIAQYHKPMRPHSGMKIEGFDEYDHWAPLFKQHQIDLAVECDSHLMKVTWPIVMDSTGAQGFRRVSKGGTVFIGEGGWGAPLRKVSDPKSWTMKSGRINHVFFVEISPQGGYTLRVLEVSEARADVARPWQNFMWRRASNQGSLPPVERR